MFLFSDLPGNVYSMSMTDVINSLQFCQFQASVCQLGWHLLVKTERSERRRDQEELRDNERAEPDLTGGQDEEGRETMMQCKTGPSDQR